MVRGGSDVRVSVVRGGGLAGLTSVTSLDSARLDDVGTRALRAAVDAARPTADVPPGAARHDADAFSYEVTVDDDGRTCTLRRSDADLTPALRDLLTLVLSAPERERHVRPAGR